MYFNWIIVGRKGISVFSTICRCVGEIKLIRKIIISIDEDKVFSINL